MGGGQEKTHLRNEGNETLSQPYYLGVFDSGAEKAIPGVGKGEERNQER